MTEIDLKIPGKALSTAGDDMHQFITELYPICRSITGEGVRTTLTILGKLIPLNIYEVPSGTEVFDWVVPKEWSIRDAYIKNSKGKKIVDFKNSNLHIMSYSTPIHTRLKLDELKDHIHTDPEHPDWIPYRTSYYKDNWAFCMSFNQFNDLQDDIYEVCIDSKLEDGNLTYAECFIPGETSDEVLISTHICHSSLCDDNLSGIAVATFLAKALLLKTNRYSYRFVFIPGTIGSITWLSVNENKVKNIKHGLIATLLGDGHSFTYKRSRQGNAEIDQIVEHHLTRESSENRVIDFSPYGYDERQFCSPGFNLPVGCLTRNTYGEFPEYHTSADNLDFVKPVFLEESFNTYLEIFNILEHNKRFVNLNPKCEPQLGKRGLYDTKGGANHTKEFQMALLWTLNLSDGNHSLLEIAKRSNIDFDIIRQASQNLVEKNLLREVR